MEFKKGGWVGRGLGGDSGSLEVSLVVHLSILGVSSTDTGRINQSPTREGQ